MRELRRILPLVDGALCAILLLLLLADLLWPDAGIFLNDFVKAYLLITCLVSAFCGVMLVARQRRLAGRRTRW